MHVAGELMASASQERSPPHIVGSPIWKWKGGGGHLDDQFCLETWDPSKREAPPQHHPVQKRRAHSFGPSSPPLGTDLSPANDDSHV